MHAFSAILWPNSVKISSYCFRVAVFNQNKPRDNFSMFFSYEQNMEETVLTFNPRLLFLKKNYVPQNGLHLKMDKHFP